MRKGEKRICQTCPLSVRLASGCNKRDYLPRDQQTPRTFERLDNMAQKTPMLCHRRIREKRPDLFEYILDYDWLDSHGVLPEVGGYKEQEARWVSAMNLIRAIYRRVDAEEMERTRGKSNNHQPEDAQRRRQGHPRHHQRP